MVVDKTSRRGLTFVTCHYQCELTLAANRCWDDYSKLLNQYVELFIWWWTMSLDILLTELWYTWNNWSSLYVNGGSNGNLIQYLRTKLVSTTDKLAVCLLVIYSLFRAVWFDVAWAFWCAINLKAAHFPLSRQDICEILNRHCHRHIALSQIGFSRLGTCYDLE